MFNQKMVACLKANGKVLREFNDTVYVPYGSEYQIYLKNLNTVRAIVNITIDGTDVVPGGLVVNANQEIDLERFVKDMSKGNKFKFIERTAGIESHRGVKAEDGLIRISYKYAKVVPQLWSQPFVGNSQWPSYPPGVRGSLLGGEDHYMSKGMGASTSGMTLNSISASSAPPTKSATRSISAQASGAQLSNDIGITVPGSLSEQKFVTVSDFVTESEEHVIVLKILGETENSPVVAPVTVKTKPKCISCGRVNKATSKFCNSCGTSLEII